MALSSQIISDFKGAAKSIFDAMVSTSVQNYVYQPRKINPVTGVYELTGQCYHVRAAVVTVPVNRIKKENYHVGDMLAYVLFDEIDFAIRPGSEFRLPLRVGVDQNIIDSNDDCFDTGDIIVGGSSFLTPVDFIIAGDSLLEIVTSILETYKIYTIVGVDVDGAEAAYKLHLRAK